MKLRIGLLALALVLTGCGRGADGAKPEAAKDVKQGASTGTIKVWAMGGEGDKLPELAKEFEAANPGTKIEVTSIPWQQAHDKLAGAIAARTTPDVSLVGTSWMAEFGKTGALDPVPGLIDRGKFFPSSLRPPTVGGTLYGVPWYVDTRVLFYRKDLAEKAGFDQAPKTWEEMKKLAKAYQDKAGAKWGMFLPPGKVGSGQVFLPMLWQQGSDLVGADGRFTLDTPQAVKALEYYRSYFEEKISPRSTQPGDTDRWFVDGSLGMQITGPWMVAQFLKLGGDSFKDKFAVAPVPGDKTRTSFVGGADLVVYKDSKNRDAAWRFVNWLTDPAVQVKWYGLQKDLPSVQSAWDDPALKDNDKVAPFGVQLKDTKAPPTIATYEEVNQMVEGEIEKAVVGGEKPADVVKSMQSKADGIGTGS